MLRTRLGVALAVVVLLSAVTAAAQHPDDAFAGQKAPRLKSSEWINTAPLTLEELRGKVVLIDFWAYDCPECAKTMPHLKEMHAKYARQGLVIIGVHTPRIDYEKDVDQVRLSVKEKGIEYPVTIDNEYLTWSDYLCAAWPTHFVVDKDGTIQLSHTGIGRYEDTEKMIQKLLADKSN